VSSATPAMRTVERMLPPSTTQRRTAARLGEVSLFTAHNMVGHARAVRQNDRVRCQACFQAVPVRSMALSVTTSLRMQAVSASLAGFPARRSRS
jgi:hypothetical protein